MRSTFRIGCGAGFSGDRLDAAVELLDRCDLDVLVLECLAERTIALAQLQRRAAPDRGYDSRLEARMEGLLPLLASRRVRLVSNLGAANPLGAAKATLGIARRLGLAVKVAAVTGDDVLDLIDRETPSLEDGRPLSSYGELVSANAYLGSEALIPALSTEADVVIAGRVADPSLFVAPLMHHYGTSPEEVDRIANFTVVGHLLECAGQLTGGYFADPGVKDVPRLEDLGFPYADVDVHGNATFGKPARSGGVLNIATAKEQLLYEVTDPRGYITPDVVADFSRVDLSSPADDVVIATGARGRTRPDCLKVSVGYLAGFLGEGEIGYAGPNALARARLAAHVVQQRLKADFSSLRIDYIGCTSLHGESTATTAEPYEVRLRVAGRAASSAVARRIGDEIEALYTNGPAGGGGVRTALREQVGIVSTLIPRDLARATTTLLE